MTTLLRALLIAFSILFVFFITNSHSQQVWTYDFGDATGSFTSGDITNPGLLPSTQADGGDTRLRIGGGNEIIISQTGNDIGTFSRMILEASPTGGLNTFAIAKTDATELLYFRASIKLSVAATGNENDFYILFNTDDAFDINTLQNASNIGGLRFRIQDGAELEDVNVQRRRNGGWQETFGFGDGLIDLDEKVIVEAYLNNSGADHVYYRNGEELELNANTYAIYLNDQRIAGKSGGGNSDLNRDDLTEQGIATIRFQGGGTDGDEAQIEIDDIVYSNALPDIRTIEGDDQEVRDGWRMLALPYNTDVEQLARQNLVQGITGGDFPGAGANIFTSHSGVGEATSKDSDWSAPENINTTLNRGNGFIWGLYDNADVLQSKPLPMNLTITGTQDPGDVTVSLSGANDGWNLLGNPFSSDLDVSDLENWAQGGSFESAVIQIYDPVSEGYILSTGNDDKVAAFQGFFLENNDADEIIFPENAAGGDDAQFYKQQNDKRLISFNITATDAQTERVFKDRAFNLIFTENSAHEWDMWDASKLTPLSQSYTGMAFVGERQGEIRLKAQESRPFNLQESVSVPVEFFSAGVNGTAELSVKQYDNIPADWSIEIEDTQTGIRQLLSEDNSFIFDFSATSQAKEIEEGVISAPVIATAKVSDESPRFVMHITPGENFATQLPDNFTLHQNYPNPFNPTTVISYELPENSFVSLEVYDMVGRQVASLVNGQVQAGMHQVNFDASGLSSGVYLYRLTAGNTVLSRRLTVLK
ncbi:MAG: T9SS type A sorting domain-containing protein [Balneolaceae bacterium]|nr:T9SS type A sorting domain-containing protein [Balneolaceae bacterium]